MLARLDHDPPGDPAGLVPLPLRAAMQENLLAQNDPAQSARLVRAPGSPLHHRLDGPADIGRLLCLSSAAWLADESDVAVTAFRQAYAMLRPHGSLGMAVMCIRHSPRR
jgi:hypothetical protein